MKRQTRAAIGLTRVSTKDQADNGVSLEMQNEKVRLYAQLHDLVLIDVIVENGISGKSLDKRPGMRKVLRLAETGKVAAVIVYKLDRAFRNVREALEAAELFKKHDVAFISVTEQIDTRSAHGKLFYTLLAAFAEWERNIIAERTKEALQQKKRNGERVGRWAQRGYQIVDSEDGERKLVEDEHEKAAITRARALASRGLSLRLIARTLGKEGYLSRSHKEYSATAIRRMLAK